MTSTQHLIDGANRAQASRIQMTTTRLSPEDPIMNVASPYIVWSVVLTIQNLGEETAHDFECSVDPVNTDAIRNNPGKERLREQSAYLQAGGEFGAPLYVPLPVDDAIGTEDTLRPTLRFTDVTGQRWNLEHHRRLTKVDQ